MMGHYLWFLREWCGCYQPLGEYLFSRVSFADTQAWLDRSCAAAPLVEGPRVEARKGVCLQNFFFCA